MRHLHVMVALTFLVFDLVVVSLCPLVGLTLLPSVFGAAFWLRAALEDVGWVTT